MDAIKCPDFVSQYFFGLAERNVSACAGRFLGVKPVKRLVEHSSLHASRASAELAQRASACGTDDRRVTWVSIRNPRLKWHNR